MERIYMAILLITLSTHFHDCHEIVQSMRLSLADPMLPLSENYCREQKFNQDGCAEGSKDWLLKNKSGGDWTGSGEDGLPKSWPT